MTYFSANCRFKLIAILLLFATLGGFTGCAPVLSKQLRQEAEPPIPFAELQQAPDTYKGRVVILGGYILETANDPNGSRLTILETPLDSRNRPSSPDLTRGRFLVRTKKFLEPEVYSKDRAITVGGKVEGFRQEPLGNRSYVYPLIGAQEIYLWPEKYKYVGPYYPYFYDPWYGPWYDPWYYPWYRPWYPYRRYHRHHH
jgi:outer membrane lipoprotein